MTASYSNVLVIGNGAREHCLSLKLSESPNVNKVYVIPGNGGTNTHKIKTITNVDSSRIEDLVNWSVKNEISLVIPGGEQLLVEGICDAFKKVGINCFGPSKKASMLEGSKAYSKNFMKKYNIPTAKYEIFTNCENAINFVNELNHPFVIKVSGLAAGKGVFLPESKSEAKLLLESIMLNKIFGDSGNEVVIEERLYGEELSILCLCDGYTIRPLLPSQDHKRVFDNDKGLNTGGMGAYSPVSIAKKNIMNKINDTILAPTVKGMRKEGSTFMGALFVGIMLTTNNEAKVIEYNVRLGDPETQAVLPLLRSDLFELLTACIETRLDTVDIEFSEEIACTVVISSGGYPNNYEKNIPVSIDEKVYQDRKITVYHAGTKSLNKKLYTNGGRVFSITGIGESIDKAISKAYEGVNFVRFNNMHYRTDIAHREKSYNSKTTNSTYKQSGVDVEAGNDFVNKIKPLVKATQIPGADSEIGGFGGLFDLSLLNYKDPILVSSTDGVGTKLKLSIMMNKYDTIGIDLVAMSVNDIIVQGADPIYFLDYYSCSKLHTEIAVAIVSGIAEGCKQSECALIGGETAEMPGIYSKNDYDMAGFCVGVVERDSILPKAGDIKEGDFLIGLPSSGVHSNGYSLVYHIMEQAGLSYQHSIKDFNKRETIGDQLLKPTKIYVKQLKELKNKGLVKAMAHITGGGIIENLPRVLPKEFSAEIVSDSWPMLPIFKFLKDEGNVEPLEMFRTFNSGIGMILVVDSSNMDQIKTHFETINEPFYEIGKITLSKRETERVVMKNIDKAFK